MIESKENDNAVPIKENYDFYELHKNDYLYSKFDGIPLIFKEKKEKNKFVQTLEAIKEDIEKNNSIDDVKNKYMKNEDLTNRHIKNINHFCLFIIFYLISPFFGIINLIGIFQIIAIMKALNRVFYYLLKYYFKYRFTNFTEEEYQNLYDKDINFYKIFFENSQDKQLIDFNLIFFTSILGNLLLKTRGFRVSSSIFLLTNCISLVLLLNYKFDEKLKNVDYSFLSILYIGGSWLLLFLGVGASAILSQQILIDSYMKYKEFYLEYLTKEINKLPNDSCAPSGIKNKAINELEDMNDPLDKKEDYDQTKIGRKETIKNTRKENFEKRRKRMEQNKLDYFFMICFITIVGYYIKYIINNFLIYNENKKGINPNKEYNYFKKICILYPSSILLSIIIYCFFACIFTKNKEEEEKSCCSCKCCESEDKFRMCQICGYTIYSQKIVLLKKTPTCNCLKLSCRVLDNCLAASCYSLLTFCPCEECQEERQKSNFDEFFCCLVPCGCNDDIVYDKNTEYFCYCYQERRKLNFIYKYINNAITRTIFPYIIEYFCLRFTTIGFERQCELFDKDDKMNANNYANITNGTEIFNKTNFISSNNLFLFLEDNFTGEIQNNSFDFSFMLIFIGSFILFFYLTISLSRFLEAI